MIFFEHNHLMPPNALRKSWIRQTSGLFILLFLAVAPLASGQGTGADESPATPEGEAMSPRHDWKEVDRLISEDKHQAALEITGELRTAAVEAGDTEEWTRALIKETQLRTGLSGFETAVRFLRTEEWPESALGRLALELYYAHSLVNYLDAYSWEIGQRERVESSEEVDLKAWTQGQIVAEARAAYGRVWQEREAWGSESLGALSEYIDQNTYPARIRGTLRDAVTYLWVELLTNTSRWRPEQSTNLWRLDLESLLGDAPATDAPATDAPGTDAPGTDAPGTDVDLADPDLHPLRAACALLADLETWHRTRERPEAAFEARLERLRRLHSAFNEDDDRKLLEANLETHLEALGQRFEWWAMGQSTLAEFVRQRGDLVRARELAQAGLAVHPKSPGGRRCLHLVTQIEAPAYELASMAVDGPGRRSIQVRHKNLESLHFRAYPVDLLRSLKGSRDYNLLPDRRRIPEFLERHKPSASWSVDLPPTPDFELHSTYVTPPFQAPGLYVVVASARKDFAVALNSRAALNFIVSDLVLFNDHHDGVHHITVRSGASGAVLDEVEMHLYRADWRKGHEKVDARYTDARGRVNFERLEPRERHFVVAQQGEQTSFLMLNNWYSHSQGGARKNALVYTDRSVYRPRQTVHFKVVAYAGEQGEGRFQTSPGTALQVELIDANGEQVSQLSLTTNEFGSASGTFTIPAGRLLGNWHVRTSQGGSSRLQVEEYKRPTFEVAVEDPASPLRLNRAAKIGATARYYFGLPVSGGEVAWRVTRDPVIPRHWWWFPVPSQGRQTVAQGTGALGSDGTFTMKFTPEADERLAASSGLSYYYTLHVEVTDEGGETRSTQRAFRLGFVAVEATVEQTSGFFRQGQPAVLTVRRTDLGGQPLAGAGTFRLETLKQPATTLLPAELPPPTPAGGADEPTEYKTPGDLLRPRWAPDYRPERVLSGWDDDTCLKRGELEHGDDGTAALRFEDLPAGAYRLHYQTTDDFGAELEIAHEFLVAQEGATPLALPALLKAEQTSVPVGETARILVHSGLQDQSLMLEIDTPAGPPERRLLNSREGAQLIEIPIRPEHRGGVSVRLVGLRDHQVMSFEEQIRVPWDDRRLEVEFATFRDRLRPGGKETWRVTVRGAEGEALAQGAAEVLAYMYDKSLDLFASHEPPDPLGLYPIFRSSVQFSTNLQGTREIWRLAKSFVQRTDYPTFTADQLKFYDSYGIGGPGRRGGFGRGMPTVMAMSAPRSMAQQKMARAPVAEAMLEESADAEMDSLEAGGVPSPPPPPSKALPPSEEQPGAVRTNFAETAFFHPHLLLDEEGAVSFEFEVPEAVTEWNVWVHALTRDLRAGRLRQSTRTVKDLLVRPYLPRFFREGDRAELRVVVNNAGDNELEGTLDFDILHPETEESLLVDFGLDAATATGVPFQVEPGGGVNLRFPVTAPQRVGPVAIRAVARAADLSDGELRPVPVLPSRLHLFQSRFATLDDAERRVLHFPDLAADDDPSRENERLVVTLDGQLFYGVLNALPYLAEYPYQCTEQNLNRFLSTGILSSLYDQYPAVSRMADQLKGRETRLEAWDDEDPNRALLLEESPWLRQSRGNDGATGTELINVLDPEIARARRDTALAELEKAQTSLGGFPWWPGGPPSPYMTLYLMMGFSRALEFEVEVPQRMVQRGWEYLHQHYVDRLTRDMVERDCCWELITFMNYVLSNYPDTSWTGNLFTDDDRRQMLDFSFKHWRQHSPLLKGYLALTLVRSGREKDARLVWDSVMDSAKTTPDEGTFWAPEDRSWLWYNDTIESHAFALRTLSELDPDDVRRSGLVQWLFLNKKLNHWKSTRATAEVIYSLAHYLKHEDMLAQREEATVTVGPRRQTFVFEPDEYTGRKNQIILQGEEVSPAAADVVVEKETPGFLFASATWHFATDRLPEKGEGDFFNVERRYYRRVHDGREFTLEPLAEGARLATGDQIEVHLSIRTRHAAEYVHLRDPRGAGFEPERLTSGYRWDLGLGYFEEIRDSASNFFFEDLPVGEYTLKYRLRASVAGTFRVGPATLQSMYAPEFTAYSAGAVLEISGEAETP